MPDLNEAQERAEALRLLSIELYERQKKAKLDQLKAKVSVMLNQAKETRDALKGIFSDAAQTALLNCRVELSEALLSENIELITEKMNQLSSCSSGFSNPLDSPELKGRRLSK